MGNSILIDPRLMEASGVAISGGTVASTSMALTNLLTPQPSEFARFSDALPANTYVVVDLGSAMVNNDALESSEFGVFVGYANLWREFSAGVFQNPTIRIRAATSEAGLTSSPPIDTGAIPFNENAKLRDRFPRGVNHLSVIEVEHNYRWWRLDFVGEEQLDGYIELGVLAIGPVMRTVNPIGNGWSFGGAPIWVGQTAMGGQKFRRSVAAPTVLEATFQMTTREEAFDLHDLIRERGEAKPMFLAIDPDDSTALMNLSAWGFMSAPQPIAVPYYGLWQTTIRVEEMP